MKKQTMLCFALVGVLAGVNAFAAEASNWKVGGFVDGQFGWNSVTATMNSAGGFKLGDAAIRIGHEEKDSNVEIDIPVNAVLPTGFLAGYTGTGFGSEKGQAYVAHKYSMGVSWKLGMFDSPFGMESNWSDQSWAANTGLVYSLLPKTFMGATVSYTSGTLTATIMGADARNTSSWATSPGFTAVTGPDLGLQIAYGGAKDTVTAKVGFLYNSVVALGYLVDVGVGLKMGSFKADIGFDMLNPATVSQMGIFVAPTFTFSDTVGAGARIEYVSTAPSVTGLQVTAGPDFQMSKALKVRPQYTFTSPTPGTATHGVVVSAVYSM